LENNDLINTIQEFGSKDTFQFLLDELLHVAIGLPLL